MERMAIALFIVLVIINYANLLHPFMGYYWSLMSTVGIMLNILLMIISGCEMETLIAGVLFLLLSKLPFFINKKNTLFFYQSAGNCDEQERKKNEF